MTINQICRLLTRTSHPGISEHGRFEESQSEREFSTLIIPSGSKNATAFAGSRSISMIYTFGTKGKIDCHLNLVQNAVEPFH